jgi:hypothetical protein
VELENWLGVLNLADLIRVKPKQKSPTVIVGLLFLTEYN